MITKKFLEHNVPRTVFNNLMNRPTHPRLLCITDENGMIFSVFELDLVTLIGKFEVWALFCDPVDPEYIVIIT